MAHLQRSAVALRFSGDDLIPDEVSRLLDASSTHAPTTGDEFIGKKPGQLTIASFGMWRLCASNHEPADMDAQIQEILSQATGDLSVWRSITKEQHAALFCGLFKRVANEGAFRHCGLPLWEREAWGWAWTFTEETRMKRRPAANQITGANSRAASPLGVGRPFGRALCAQPSLAAAVARFWRSVE